MSDSIAVHLHLSTGVVATRVFREARSVLRQRIFTKVIYIGLWESGLLQHEMHSSGLEILRIKTLLREMQARGHFTSRTIIRKLLALISFFEWCLKAIISIVRIRPKYVVCHNVHLLPVAYIAALVVRGRMVYMPHELESEASFVGPKRKLIFRAMERFFAGRCYAVVVVNEPILKWYQREIGIKGGFSLRSIPEGDGLPDGSQLFRHRFSIPDDEVIFVYQGLLGPDRGIGELVRAFIAVPGSHLVLMGYGEMQKYVEDASSRWPNIHFHPAVPMAEIVRTASSADVGLFFLEGELPLSYRLSLPNKFFEYVHAGLPVIVSRELTYLAELVIENEIGWVADGNDFSQLISGLTSREVEARARNVRRFASENVWATEEKLFLNIYK